MFYFVIVKHNNKYHGDHMSLWFMVCHAVAFCMVIASGFLFVRCTVCGSKAQLLILCTVMINNNNNKNIRIITTIIIFSSYDPP